MDTVTYPDSDVSNFIHRHFIPVKLKVKANPDLAREYLVGWTPNVVIADEQDKIHARIEGYLPPHDFVARLSLAEGKHRLNVGQFAAAAERFDEVAQRHGGTEAAAEALYWRAVVAYKQSHDPAQLRNGWKPLLEHYGHSEWARRAEIPKPPGKS